jgi:hypothetical protein
MILTDALPLSCQWKEVYGRNQTNSRSLRIQPPQKLFIPDPIDVLPQVLEAQTAPMIAHRADEAETGKKSSSEKGYANRRHL